MCGICGFYGFKDSVLIAEMCGAIRHRGPDQSGVYEADNVSLGHSRLSIIDLSQMGGQPMTNEHNNLWLAFNGEIYNFQELKKTLEKKGHKFKSHTDSEVILHAYEEKGIDCVDDFRGMFSFALWDSKQEKLILCRDRLGIKPLYYYWDGKKLIFASEIKSIIQYRGLLKEVNLESLYSFLVFQYTPGLETAIKGVRKVPPGHMLLLERGGFCLKEYWSFDSVQPESWRGGEKLALEKLDELLEESVSLRLISDVPLGVLLSGGLDSSAVVALMRRNSTRDIKTFSVGFGQENDELKYAGIVSRKFNTEHKEFLVKPKNLVGTLEKIVWHLDEPIADGGAFATFLVSEVVKDYVKVILVGEGADELFGGYSWHKLGNSYFRIFPKELKTKLYFYLNTFSRNGFNRHIDFNNLFHGRDAANKSFLSGMINFEMRNLLPNCLLMKVDKMTMAHSIEARVPFLDHKLLEFVHTLPARYKVRGFTGKHLLRKNMLDTLPPEILKRRKRGFLIPLDKWMEQGLSEYSRDVLLNNSSFVKEFLGKKKLEDLFGPHKYLRAIESRILLWRLLIFETWHKFYIKDVKRLKTLRNPF